jgi:chorismate synthase
MKSGKMDELNIVGRHDLCIALRVPVIIEAITAIALADLMIIEQKIPKIIKSENKIKIV